MELRPLAHQPVRPPKPAPKNSALESIGLGTSVANIEVYLDGDEYKNIDEHSAARMLGHFTQAMQAQGFPWRLYASSKEGLTGKLTGTKTLSDMDALRRLQRGEAVLFQPMRNLQLDLSSDSLGAIAAAGTLSPGSDMSSVSRLAALSKNTRVSPGSQGYELKHGEPVEVKNLAELKLLYQMYRPEETISTKNPVARAASQLAYFNQQQGDYGWRFYQKDQSNALGRIAKQMYQNGLKGAAMGAAVGAMVGIPLGLVTQSLKNFLLAVAAGSGAFALYGGAEGARTAAKGKPLNTVAALDAVLKKQPLEFQETQMRSVGVPVLGKVSWFTDRGANNTVSSPQELETLYWMQNQAAKQPEEPKPTPPAPPTTVIIDQSQHYYPSPFR
jgi:hypothetical protein